jgi:hypothetical protein
VDFGGATLRGVPETIAADERKGTGVLVRGRNVTIRNLHVHGYKICLIVLNSPGLKSSANRLMHNEVNWCVRGY